MINSYDLFYFQKVAETLNLRLASEHLGISQPALSHSLKRLEEELAVALFLRRKDGLVLTREGRLFLSKSKSIAKELHQLSTLFKAEEEDHFEITLGLHPSVALYSMDKLLNIKSLRIKFILGLSRDVTDMAHKGMIDAALAINPTAHPELMMKQICQDTFALWATPNCDEKTLFVDTRLFQTQEIMRDLEKKKINFSKMIELTDLNLIARLVAKGQGVGLLPKRVLNENCQDFYRYMPKTKEITDELFLIYPVENKHGRGIEILKEHLLKNLA